MSASVSKKVEEALRSPFGSVFAEKMAISYFRDNEWSSHEIQPLQPLSLHPGAHVLQYASTCFEGMKVHRRQDGSDRVFRLDRHIHRMQSSASLLCLPSPEEHLLEAMIRDLVAVCRDWIPPHPGSLYIRPTLIGTHSNIGSAADASEEACLYIILSPVGDYFVAGKKPLSVLIDDVHMRATPDFGMAKAGGNYASALRYILEAKSQYGANQVLFAPGGDVQETGAANFLLLNDREILTKKLDASFLHGVTRDSILELAATVGYKVIEDDFSVEDALAWAKTGEAALSGTAAVLAGIGSIIYRGHTYPVGDGGFGPNTLKLRDALISIQNGSHPDSYGWLTEI